MRALGLLAVLIAVPVAAKPKKLTPRLPDIVKEAVARARIVEPDTVLGMDGNVSAALVVKPGLFGTIPHRFVEHRNRLLPCP